MHATSIRRALVTLAFAVLIPPLSYQAFADPINISSSSVPSFVIQPSSDTISLNDGSVTLDSASASHFVFQTGDFYIGDSPIPDQVISFSLQDTVTINGVTQTFTIYGQNDVTNSYDYLTIFAGAPIIFGNEIFTLQPFDAPVFGPGGDVPVYLVASVTPVPEPGSILLLGTGLVAGAVAIAARTHCNPLRSVS